MDPAPSGTAGTTVSAGSPGVAFVDDHSDALEIGTGAFKPQPPPRPAMTGDDTPDDTARETSREEFTHDPVEHVQVTGGMSVADLVDQYGGAGIGAGDIHEAVDIVEEMLRRDDVSIFFGLAGAMVPAGMRRVVSDMVRDGHVDALVTTGATLTHDTIEAIGGHHHHGRESGDGTLRNHDEQLRAEGIDRIYDTYLPQEHFTALESHLREAVFPNLSGSVGIADLAHELGRANAEFGGAEAIEADPGIAAAAAAHDVPVYCPAVQDSILGLQAWMHSQVTDFTLDALTDMNDLNDLANDAPRAGAMVVGGGVPKNYVLQTMLVAPGAYDYAVQLTMDPPQTGGLSGAPLDEARSWGKLERSARNASVYADATITLPLVIAAARDHLDE